MIFNQLRTYKANHTDSVIYANGNFVCYGLEDIGRPAGVKIAKETCIPEGCYIAEVTYSPAFKREMVILYNIKDDHSIERHGVRFTGIRQHGGNNVEHSAGCGIVAKHTNRDGRVWESMEAEITKLVKNSQEAGEKVFWVISESV